MQYNSIEFSNSGNVVYYIDYNNKLVLARIKCNEDDPQLVFDSQFFKQCNGKGLGPLQEMDVAVHKYRIRRDYIGKAKCHPDDEFDVELGKRLALLRAKRKYLRAMENKMALIDTWMTEMCDRTHDICRSQYRQWIDNETELEKMEASL